MAGSPGLNEHSIGLNYHATTASFRYCGVSLHDAKADEMPKENSGITFEDCEPSKVFREFAIECMELAQTASSPEKRAVYLKMASVGIRWRSDGKRKASGSGYASAHFGS